MRSRDFCYWLQGYLEIQRAGAVEGAIKTSPLMPKQVEVIQSHLSLVFKHEIDPSEPGDAAENQAIHDGPNSHLHNNVRPDGTLVRC